MRRKLLIGVATVLLVALGTQHSLAQQLTTEAKVLEETFKSGYETKAQYKALEGEALEKVAEKLGGSLDYKGDSPKEGQRVVFKFTEVYKDDKLVGVAHTGAEPGKWGQIEFVVVLEPNGKVKHVALLALSERRGRPVARASFLRQFNGKSAKDHIMVRRDITGISGATVSAESVTFAVKKTVLAYSSLYPRPEEDK